MVSKPIFINIDFKVSRQKSIASSDSKETIASADERLWQEFKTGSESAFAEIYEQNAGRLYSYGLKLVYDKELVKDCIQDLFVEIWNTKERLGSVHSIKDYLYKSFRRLLLKTVSKNRKKIDNSKPIDDLKVAIDSPENMLIEKQSFDEELQALQNALVSLSDKQKELVHLKFYGKLNYNEIAEVMSLDKKAVYNLMTRTINRLKQLLVLPILIYISFYIF